MPAAADYVFEKLCMRRDLTSDQAFRIACVCQNRQDWKKFQRIARLSLKRDSVSAHSHYLRGQLAYILNLNKRKALEELRTAVDLDPADNWRGQHLSNVWHHNSLTTLNGLASKDNLQTQATRLSFLSFTEPVLSRSVLSGNTQQSDDGWRTSASQKVRTEMAGCFACCRSECRSNSSRLEDSKGWH